MTSSPGVRRRAPGPGERKIDADRTRAALLDAALEEFAARGYAGARIRDIAERAGVSKDLVAYHFGGKEGLYLAVQQAWLDREQSFSDPSLPLADLIARYAHDALADPRPMRLLAWRGLTDPSAAPPDGSPGWDLASTQARQEAGELPADVDPAVLRLVLTAAVAAPVIFPAAAAQLFGIAVTDPEFERAYTRGLRDLIAGLSQPGPGEIPT